MEKVFVTGATGFVGSWLVKELLSREVEVIALIRDFDYQSELIRSGDIKKIYSVRGDVQNFQDIERALNEYQPDTVIHLAAQPLVGISLRNPLHTFEVNIRGTYNLLEACRWNDNGLKAIVIASSDKAYGTSEVLPYTEQTPLAGDFPYEVSKSCADMLANTYRHTYYLPITVMRCANIYGGADLNWDRIVPGTIRSVLRGEQPIIRSSGQFIRDYIYVKDAVNAIISLVDNIAVSCGSAFNFGTGIPISVQKLVHIILNIMESDLKPQILDIVTQEIYEQYLDSTLAEKMMKWKPKYHLNEGLEETIAWYKKYLSLEK